MTAPRCDICPLREFWTEAHAFAPVQSELNHTDTAVVGEAPTKQDTAAQRPFFDGYGAKILDALNASGKSRTDVAYINVVNCRFPADDRKSYLAKLKAKNRARARKGEAAIPTPMECCAPRFKAEVARYKNLIPMGELAIKSVLPGSPNPSEVRGGPRPLGDQRVLPTFHPRDLVVQPKYKEVFHNDIAKAFRYFENRLNWSDPRVIWNPTPATLRAIVQRWRESKAVIAYDLETDAIESLDAEVRCVGLGTQEETVQVHLLSRDRTTPFYDDSIGPWCGTKDEEKEIRAILVEFFTDPAIKKTGWNSGYYDRIVAEERFGVTPTPHVDGILLHRLAKGEYPHGLGFVGSVHTDVVAWKSEHAATEAKSDYELGAYCATDVAVTDRVLRPLKALAQERNQLHLYSVDAKLQNACVGMHRLGMRIDEQRRREHEEYYEAQRDKWLTIVLETADINPNSHEQLRDLLYRKWRLPVGTLTTSGEPSTNNDNLIRLLGNPLVDPDQRRVIDAVRRYKKANTMLIRYLYKFGPGGDANRHGRVHADYNVHGTVARLSSSGPNFQNVPSLIRDIFIPPKGCVFIYADYDQLELRFAAALAGAQFYLDAFEKREIDPHNLTAELMYGPAFWSLPGHPGTKLGKGTGKFADVRGAAKTIGFASLYGAGVPTVTKTVQATEDRRTGDLPYSHYNVNEVRALHRRWLRRVPEIELWWDKTIEFYRRHGYVMEPVLGRRRYFHWEDYNAILNFPVQAGGFAVGALGTIELIEKHIPFDFRAGTGLCAQVHDSVTFVVKEEEAEEKKEIVTRTLTREVPGLPVTFSAEAEIIERWN